MGSIRVIGSLLARACFIVLLSAAAAGAQQTETVTGRVLSAAGAPASDAEVTLVEMRRRVRVAGDGTFRIENVPAGSYLLEVFSPRSGRAVRRIRVPAETQAPLEVRLDLPVHQEQITVTGSEARSLAETAQPITVLSERELLEKVQPTLGETLAAEPGVNSTYFGPGSSRPVIRGLGGDRIRILESGIGSGDASTTSPDHAVSADPISAEKIEILRGPATLLYGSSAIGGVVNILDGRIPDYLPQKGIGGRVELRGGTVSNERGGTASLTGAFGRFAWHLDALKRETDDTEIPGTADADGEGPRGILPNSATESDGGTLGFSYVGEGGFLGVSGTLFNTLYGIPGHGEEGGAKVRVDLEQRRLDLKGEITRPFGFFRGLKLRFGTTNYEHVELEDNEVGTRFLNDSWEARVEAPHKRVGILTGSFGAQFSNRDFKAIGAEAFVPPTETDAWALFAFEELDLQPIRLQFGARYENQDVAAATGQIRDRSLDGLSGSLGLVWLPSLDYALGLSVARSVKLPNAEELFSNGPHLATGAFEVGNPALNEETSLGADLSFRKLRGSVTFEASVFATRYDDFIFEQATGEREDNLPVFRFVQRDAKFQGAELHVDFGLVHTDPHHLGLELFGDYVRAELRATGEPLPRIPPSRYGTGLRYRGPRFSANIEVRRVDKQDRVARLEEVTRGYTMLNAGLGFRFFFGNVINEILLRGSNLTDEEARSHISFLKNLAPLPGRDVSLAYRLSF